MIVLRRKAGVGSPTPASSRKGMEMDKVKELEEIRTRIKYLEDRLRELKRKNMAIEVEIEEINNEIPRIDRKLREILNA